MSQRPEQLRSELIKRNQTISSLRQILNAYKEQLEELRGGGGAQDSAELEIKLKKCENEREEYLNLSNLYKEQVDALHNLVAQTKTEISATREDASNSIKTVRTLTDQIEGYKRKLSKAKNDKKGLEKKLEKLERKSRETSEEYETIIDELKRESEADLSAAKEELAELACVVSRERSAKSEIVSKIGLYESMLMQHEDMLSQNHELYRLREELEDIKRTEANELAAEMERKLRELEDSLKREQQSTARLQAEREVLLEKVGGKQKYGSRENSVSQNIVLLNDDSLRGHRRSPSRSPNRPSKKGGGILDEPLLGPGLVSTYGGVNSNTGTPQRRDSMGSTESGKEEENGACCCCCSIC